MMMLDCVEGGAGTCRNADALEEAEADLLSVRTALANEKAVSACAADLGGLVCTLHFE